MINGMMFDFRNSILLLMLSIVIASVSGCYPDWPEHSGTAQVEGEVLLDGMPLLKGKVVFVPVRVYTDTAKRMPIVFGECDALGVYTLRNPDGTPEILAGNYNVMISLIDKTKKPHVSLGPVLSEVAIGQDNQSRTVALNMLARCQKNSQSNELLDEAIDQFQTVPAIYNRESNLYRMIEPTPGKVYLNFKLHSVDPLIKASKKE